MAVLQVEFGLIRECNKVRPQYLPAHTACLHHNESSSVPETSRMPWPLPLLLLIAFAPLPGCTHIALFNNSR